MCVSVVNIQPRSKNRLCYYLKPGQIEILCTLNQIRRVNARKTGGQQRKIIEFTIYTGCLVGGGEGWRVGGGGASQR